MGEIARSVISENNKYWIPGKRALELRYFCRQYPEWKTDLIRMNGYNTQCAYHKAGLCSTYLDPTADTAMARSIVQKRIDMVERCAKQAEPENWRYILQAVTEPCTYEYLRMNKGLLISEYAWRNAYRKFFWLLSVERG